MKRLTYIEIDVDRCALRFGETNDAGTCPAVLETGEQKCWNTQATCVVREAFLNQPVTLRFAAKAAATYLPREIDHVAASLTEVAITPTRISLGDNLGQRGVLDATFEDHRWPDTGIGGDPYLEERDYDPARQGSFWGKFRARQPYLRGRPLRLIRGWLGQSFSQMEVRHYIIDSFDGPDHDGRYRITARDALKLASDERSVAPRPNRGFLVGAIADDSGSALLGPSGIGDVEYPASGYLNIGNTEIVAFTRSGDTLTLTARGQLGTTASAHNENDLCQVVLRYVAQDPANIIADLLENYAGVPSEWIPLSAWQLETELYLGRLYSADIAVPTGVDELVSQLVAQAALAIWTDDLGKRIRLAVLRQIPTDAARFTPDNMLEGSFSIREQPDKRASQVWAYYGPLNPLESLDHASNYRSVLVTVNAQAETDYGSAVVRKVYGRWIPAFGIGIAERLNTILLGRFVHPPRLFRWSQLAGAAEGAALGGGYRLEAWPIQDATGAAADAPAQVTQLVPGEAVVDVEAEEALFVTFDPGDNTDRVILIGANYLNFNALDAHNSIYPPLTDEDVTNGVTLTITIAPNVIVGSVNTTSPAFLVPAGWPSGFTPKVVNLGRIQGAGGRGGTPGTNANGGAGQPGGIALRVQHPITLQDSAGQTWGGGGGGGGRNVSDGTQRGSGGGGAGTVPGQPGPAPPFVGSGGTNATAGTSEAPGDGGYNWKIEDPGPGSVTEGDGGGPGQAGRAGHNTDQYTGGPGGAAGAAIVGLSLITQDGAPGDRRGPQTG